MSALLRMPKLENAVSSVPTSKHWRRVPVGWLYELRSHQAAVLIALLLITFVVYFYAADLKGIWFDEAVRLMIANGGVPTANLENRHPGDSAAVLKAIKEIRLYQPAFFLLVNWILRLTHSYSIIPIVTTNLFIFLFSAIGIHLLARRFLPPVSRLLATLLYVWNGFAMMHVLQVREYPLILFVLVYNILFFYQLLDSQRGPYRKTFWLIALAHCVTAVGAYFTSNWAPFLLWPQGFIALLALRRATRGAVMVLVSLGITALSTIPSLLSAPKNSLVFPRHDQGIQSLSALLSRLHAGTEYLIIGYLSSGRPFLEIYYWGVLAILIFGLVIFGFRFFRERFEIQHLVLTTFAFLGFQIAYFLRDPISTWPRYFIFYLPYVVLLIPLSFSRVLALASQPARRRNWSYAIVAVIVFVAGCSQVQFNYRNPLVDHGADFRRVYAYLIGRVSPRDKVVVGGSYNQKALIYYWPNPRQIETRYQTRPKERANPPPNIWIVNYKFDKRVEYQRYASELEKMGYRRAVTQNISRVSIHQFKMTQPALNSVPKSRGEIETSAPPLQN